MKALVERVRELTESAKTYPDDEVRRFIYEGVVSVDPNGEHEYSRMCKAWLEHNPRSTPAKNK